MHFLIIFSYHFFRSVSQGHRAPGYMFEKGDDEREKQTNKTKIRNINSNCPLIENRNIAI